MSSSSSPYKPTDFAGALASLSDPAPDADVPRLTGDASAVIPGSDLTEGQFAALPPEEQKRHRRLIRNRLSAHLHRQRQRGHIDAMEAQVLELALVADEMRERLGAARRALAEAGAQGVAERIVPPGLLSYRAPREPGLLGFTGPVQQLQASVRQAVAIGLLGAGGRPLSAMLAGDSGIETGTAEASLLSGIEGDQRLRGKTSEAVPLSVAIGPAFSSTLLSVSPFDTAIPSTIVLSSRVSTTSNSHKRPRIAGGSRTSDDDSSGPTLSSRVSTVSDSECGQLSAPTIPPGYGSDQQTDFPPGVGHEGLAAKFLSRPSSKDLMESVLVQPSTSSPQLASQPRPLNQKPVAVGDQILLGPTHSASPQSSNARYSGGDDSKLFWSSAVDPDDMHRPPALSDSSINLDTIDGAVSADVFAFECGDVPPSLHESPRLEMNTPDHDDAFLQLPGEPSRQPLLSSYFSTSTPLGPFGSALAMGTFALLGLVAFLSSPPSPASVSWSAWRFRQSSYPVKLQKSVQGRFLLDGDGPVVADNLESTLSRRAVQMLASAATDFEAPLCPASADAQWPYVRMWSRSENTPLSSKTSVISDFETANGGEGNTTEGNFRNFNVSETNASHASVMSRRALRAPSPSSSALTTRSQQVDLVKVAAAGRALGASMVRRFLSQRERETFQQRGLYRRISEDDSMTDDVPHDPTSDHSLVSRALQVYAESAREAAFRAQASYPRTRAFPDDANDVQTRASIVLCPEAVGSLEGLGALSS